MPNIRVLRDMKALIRRAYLYVARNESLPPQVRHQAQLQLNTFGRYTRPDHCIMSEFALCRYQFRLKALNNEIPGVRKASW
ncbi:hypothetical protein EDD16DRAFT_1689809 [Pisolithus croceorrhizus]|nr:hypothetical protein EDD16DRAFT_1689809 [Pisolithus croceorrhizus]